VFEGGGSRIFSNIEISIALSGKIITTS